MYNLIKNTKKERCIMQALLNSSKTEVINVKTKVGEYKGYRFFPSELTEEEKQVMFQYVYFVGLSAFIQNPSEQMEADIYKHLFNEDALYLVFNKDLLWSGENIGETRVIAFLSTRDIVTKYGNMFYVSGICVDPALQGYGVGKSLMTAAYTRGTYKVASLRTQNPVMQQSFDGIPGGKSYPNGHKPPKEVLNIASELAVTLKTAKYDADKMFCPECYGSCLYGVEPDSRDNHYSDKFKEINKQSGDSMLCVKLI